VVEIHHALLELAPLATLAFGSLHLPLVLLLHLVVYILSLLDLVLGALQLPGQVGDRLLPTAGHVLHPSLLILLQRPDMVLQLLNPFLVGLPLLPLDQAIVHQLVHFHLRGG